MNAKTQTIAALIGASSLLAACGDDSNSMPIAEPFGTPSSPRTVEIAMVDTAFDSAAVTVRPGETIRFTFDNKGFLPHEAIFGDEVVQEEHETEMQAMSGSQGDMDMDMDMDMDGNEIDADDHDADEPAAENGREGDLDGGHDEVGAPPSLSLEPGETDELFITFDGVWSEGTIIGCHVPGHWAAGMRLDVAIVLA